jgi:hypothetical protein
VNFLQVKPEIDKRSGAPVALLARQDEGGLRYAGGAFFALKAPHRETLRDRVARQSTDWSPIPALRKRGALWVKPELVVGVRHLRGIGLRVAEREDDRTVAKALCFAFDKPSILQYKAPTIRNHGVPSEPI